VKDLIPTPVTLPNLSSSISNLNTYCLTFRISLVLSVNSLMRLSLLPMRVFRILSLLYLAILNTLFVSENCLRLKMRQSEQSWRSKSTRH